MMARRLLVMVLVGVVTACGPASGNDGGGEVGGTVVVQAAASLTDAFTEIGQVFRSSHPDADVTFNFAGSQTLAAQIVQGAPADVFASADAAQMQVVEREGLVDAPMPFTTNTLAIAVEAGNPFGITGLADLADPDLVVVLAAPAVPAGSAAAAALQAAGADVAPASLEVDVRSVLSKVVLGEADAGIVFASDLVTAGEAVDAVTIPAADNVVSTYHLAALAQAPNPEGAQAFVDLVLSERGHAILEGHGFTSP